VCWRFGAAGFEWCPCCRLKHCFTTQTQPHQISNTQRTENITTDVVIQQHSRKLLMMDILMSETCWVHKKWNKIASDIKLVFYSSTITMMHGPINITFPLCLFTWEVRISWKFFVYKCFLIINKILRFNNRELYCVVSVNNTNRQ